MQKRIQYLLKDEQDKKMCIWVRVRIGGERLSDVGRLFGYKDGSGVLQLVKRLESAAQKDRALAEKMENFRRRVRSVKSQELTPVASCTQLQLLPVAVAGCSGGVPILRRRETHNWALRAILIELSYNFHGKEVPHDTRGNRNSSDRAGVHRRTANQPDFQYGGSNQAGGGRWCRVSGFDCCRLGP